MSFTTRFGGFFFAYWLLLCIGLAWRDRRGTSYLGQTCHLGQTYYLGHWPQSTPSTCKRIPERGANLFGGLLRAD